MSTQTEMNNYVNNLPNISELPMFVLDSLKRSKVGKAAIKFAFDNDGSFAGFDANRIGKAKTTRFVKAPPGQKVCGDCYKSAVAEGKNEDEAKAVSTFDITTFPKIKTLADGTIKYGSYCANHTKARVKQTMANRRKAKLAGLLENARKRVAKLEAEANV